MELVNKKYTPRSKLFIWLVSSIFIFFPALLNAVFYSGSGTRFFGFLGLSAIAYSTFIFLKVNRWIILPFVIFSITVSSYMFYTGDRVGYEIIGSIYDTNQVELFQFFSTQMVQAFIFLILLISFSTLFIIPKFIHGTICFSKKKKIIILTSGLLIFLILSLAGKNIKKVYPFYLIKNTITYNQEIRKATDSFHQSRYSFSGNSSALKKGTYILVIGESVRKQSMSIYGYNKETTPCLDKIMKSDNALAVFDNMVTAAPFTRVSVPLILTLGGAENISSLADYPSILRIARSAGFKVYTVSNQSRKGFHNDVITSIFQDSDEFIFIQDKGGVYDREMLPVVDRFLKKNDEKKFIFVHMIGSHFPYENRCPEIKHLKNETICQQYDRTIIYLDNFLDHLIHKVALLNGPACLAYVSDHGENLNDSGDGNYAHGLKEFTGYELKIPLIFYFNSPMLDRVTKEFNSPDLNAPLSNENIAHAFLGLSGLRDENYYRPEKDIFSGRFTAGRRYIINRDKQVFLYDESARIQR